MKIIVTGASRGIGYALVKHLVQNLECTVLAISRNEGKLKQLQQDCERSKKGKVFVLTADITSKEIEEILAPYFENEFREVDLLINNAGYLVNKPFLALTQEDFNASYQTNVYAVVKLVQLAHSALRAAKKQAHVVNIGSMGGVMGSSKFPGLSIYSSSKGAVSILTECLAEELKEDGIAVNCLALGAVQTEMLNDAFPGYKAPLSANQMAEFIADFGIKAHQYINGKVIPVSLSTP